MAQSLDTAQLIADLKGDLAPAKRLSHLQQLASAFVRNDPQKAWDFALEAKAELAQSTDPKQKAYVNYLLGDICWYRGRYQQSLDYGHQALATLEEQEDSLGVALALNLLGKTDFRLGYYPKALRYHIHALNIQIQFEDVLAQGHSWLWQGIVKSEIGAYDEARSAYEKARTIALSEMDSLLLADAYNHIARSWRKEKRYNKAIQYQQMAGDIYRSLHDLLGQSDYFNNMGSIFRRQDQADSALYYFMQGLQIQLKLDDQEGLADSYNDIGTTYLQMGQPEFAIRNLKKGLEIAQRIGLKDDIRYAYSSLAAAYEAQEDYDAAVDAWKNLSAIRDTLLSQESARKISELAFQHERAENRQALALAKAQAALDAKNSQQIFTIIIACAGILLLIALGLLYRSRLQSRTNRQLAQTNIEIKAERERAESLLLNILPAATAEELKQTGKAHTHFYEEVSVLFTDFEGFSKLSEKLSPEILIKELDECFSAFDEIVTRFGLEKIKTIGDAYMCAAGLPQSDPEHAVHAVQAAWEIQSYMREYGQRRRAEGKPYFQARLGIHTGPVVAGVVGKKKFAYDIWGDTVNTASRLESKGEVGRINISGRTFELVQNSFICEYRGAISAKNIGEIDMYFVKWEI
ncbi:MAG: adenylate/guanylate cyclase domain-containing protein [Bacteroidota bacterium]